MLKEYSLEFLQEAMILAKKEGVTVSFDLGAAQIVKERSQDILNLLKHVDIVFANEEEATTLFPGKSKEEIITTLSSENYSSIAVVLQGDQVAFNGSCLLQMGRLVCFPR